MAYEHMTYDYIQDRKLDYITSENPNVDTRESSMIRQATAADSLELAIAYTELENTRAETFIGTASRAGKLNRCDEVGINTSIFDATHAIAKGVFNAEVEIGSRWNLDIFNYTVIDMIGADGNGELEFMLKCETAGTAPNGVLGELTAIDNIPTGLTKAEITEILTDGQNEATDDEIERFYLNKVSGSISDGNVAQYEQWCLEFTDDEFGRIGRHKITPLWNGSNTVKVSILNSSNDFAPQELIDAFQEYLDPNVEGMGNGRAPIGAFVTVDTASKFDITVSAQVGYKAGYDTSSNSIIKTAITDFFKELAFAKTKLNYLELGGKLAGCENVDSITNLKINGGTDDITCEDTQCFNLASLTINGGTVQ